MKLVTISYRHTERRSAQYQSVESSIEATVEVEPGETGSQVLAALKKAVRASVKADVESALLELIAGVPTPASVPGK